MLCSFAMYKVIGKPIKLQGEGEEAFYSGEVDAHGQPHGYGELVLALQDALEGQVNAGVFVDGSLQGVGRVSHQTGKKVTGEFVKGVLEGVGLYQYPDGTRYSGQFKAQKRHGFGTFTFIDGQAQIGWWDDDLPHGLALWVHSDGSHKSVTYEQGLAVSKTSCMIN
jgi:hypothetical protein